MPTNVSVIVFCLLHGATSQNCIGEICAQTGSHTPDSAELRRPESSILNSKNGEIRNDN